VKNNHSNLGSMPPTKIASCLFGCNNGNCAGVWVNYNTGHRIVCECECSNHKKEEKKGRRAREQARQPANTLEDAEHPQQRRTQENAELWNDQR
jgi:hypothetical protein